jgi:hypothetical protein
VEKLASLWFGGIYPESVVVSLENNVKKFMSCSYKPRTKQAGRTLFHEFGDQGNAKALLVVCA